MSWAEIKKSINSNLSKPLDTLIKETGLMVAADIAKTNYTQTIATRINPDSIDWAFRMCDTNCYTGSVLNEIGDIGSDELEGLATLADIAASETAMVAILASETAMAAIADSETAMTAVVESPVALWSITKSDYTSYIMASAYNDETNFAVALTTCANNPDYFTIMPVANHNNNTATEYYHDIICKFLEHDKNVAVRHLLVKATSNVRRSFDHGLRIGRV